NQKAQQALKGPWGMGCPPGGPRSVTNDFPRRQAALCSEALLGRDEVSPWACLVYLLLTVHGTELERQKGGTPCLPTGFSTQSAEIRPI
ncbi:hypothetical protein P7K49_021140, partial [Saguinus oedipus]